MIDSKTVVERAETIVVKIDDYMIGNNAFKNKRFSISQLAVALQMHPKTLSEIINHTYGLRFNNWVNTYRVNYTISLLSMDGWQKQSLEGLADKAGFASRSAFFAAFKQIKGRSPLDYMRNECTPAYQNLTN